MTGAFFGYRKLKPKVYCEILIPGSFGESVWRKCRIDKKSLTWDPLTGASQLTWFVPKGELVGRVVLRTVMGEVEVTDNFRWSP